MSDPQKLVDQNGRPLGPRALKTRERLLQATLELIERRGVRELSVVEIARQVGTSPATFYQYFGDVEEAALALAERASESIPDLVAPMSGPWRGNAGIETARSVVEAFLEHWDEHNAILRLRNIHADSGDERFRKLRRMAEGGALEALAKQIGQARDDGRVSAQIHPLAGSAAMLAILERLAAYHRNLEPVGVTRVALVETCAQILHQFVNGRANA